MGQENIKQQQQSKRQQQQTNNKKMTQRKDEVEVAQLSTFRGFYSPTHHNIATCTQTRVDSYLQPAGLQGEEKIKKKSEQ